MIDLRIVLMKEEHIDEVYDLLQESFSVPWSRESIREEIGCSRAVTLVALEEKEVIGYVNAHYLFDEGDLNLIAVKQAYRQKKVGTALFNYLTDYLSQRGVASLLLEVRESNINAIGFYRSFEFEQVGRRKHYYVKPQEDALLFKKRLRNK